MPEPGHSQADVSWKDDSCWKDIETIIRVTYTRLKCTFPEKLNILLRARPAISGIRQAAGLLNYPMVPSTGLFVFFSEEFTPGKNLSPLCLLQTHLQRQGRREEFYLFLQYTPTDPLPSTAAVFSVRKWCDNEQFYLAGDNLWEPASPISDPVNPNAPDYIWEEMCRGAGSKNLISALRGSGQPRLTREILMQALEQYSEPVEFLNKAGSCGRFLFLGDQGAYAAPVQSDNSLPTVSSSHVDGRIPAIVPAQICWSGMVYLFEGPGRYRIAILARILSDQWEQIDFFCKTEQIISLNEIEPLLRSYKKEYLYIRFGKDTIFAPDYPIAHNIHRALNDLRVFCESDDPAVRAPAAAFSGLLRNIPEEWSQEHLEASAFWLF